MFILVKLICGFRVCLSYYDVTDSQVFLVYSSEIASFELRLLECLRLSPKTAQL